MDIKRWKLNIALGHLIAGLFFFSGLMFFPLEEPSSYLLAPLAVVPREDPGELVSLVNQSRSLEGCLV